jgi:hypothetical protein
VFWEKLNLVSPKNKKKRVCEEPWFLPKKKGFVESQITRNAKKFSLFPQSQWPIQPLQKHTINCVFEKAKLLSYLPQGKGGGGAGVGL